MAEYKQLSYRRPWGKHNTAQNSEAANENDPYVGVNPWLYVCQSALLEPFHPRIFSTRSV